MHLKIITHERVIFDEDVDEIYSKGVNGEFGVLKGHIPYVTGLDIGVTKVLQNGVTKKFSIMGGVFKFIDEDALILTDIAESGDEIDEVRARDALARAQARLNDTNAQIDAKRAEAAIARALARLKAKMND